MSPEIVELLQTASQLSLMNRDSEAIVAYVRLLEREPALPNSWFNLAGMQRKARQFDAALASYQSALDFDVEEPEEVHLKRGVIYSDDLGRSDLALPELEAALAHNPDYVPALLNLGNLREDRGESELAQQAYDRALAIQPEHPMALARMAGLTQLTGLGDPLLARMLAIMTRPGGSSLDRADLGFALGAALDRIGAYDAAFEIYTEANRSSRLFAQTAGQRYDRKAQERLVDRLIAAFPTCVSATVADDRDVPIFICGMFRSGSTLVEQVLGRHGEVTAGGELYTLSALIETRLPNYPDGLTADNLAALRAAYLADVSLRHLAGTWLTDKRPDNFLHIGLIKTLFPGARIVHTTRNMLDNCLSVFFLHAAPNLPYAAALADVAHYYGQQLRLMAHWRAIYPDIFELDYDALVADPVPLCRELLDFCGLAWEDGVLDHRISAGAIRTASNWQVRQPLHQGSSGRWRNYRRHLAIDEIVQHADAAAGGAATAGTV